MMESTVSAASVFAVAAACFRRLSRRRTPRNTNSTADAASTAMSAAKMATEAVR